ncbi:MAG: flavodoxin [Bacteroidales bacterium]|nr:flavodoxin [Bacteroidales bacterium]
MKRFKHTAFLIISLLAALAGCGKETTQTTTPENEDPPAGQNDAKVLVACFSFTGNTKAVASSLADLSEGTLYLIEPETPYGDENRTYYDEDTRAYKEQYGPASARPAIKKSLEDAGTYDVILLGFPIWYGKAPRVVFSFLDAYSFKGKVVVPFITSGSTGITSAASELKTAYPDITWKTGDRLNGKTAEQLKSWLDASGIKVN